MSRQRLASVGASLIPPHLTALDSRERALAVVVQWGEGNALHSEHIALGGGFWVGDGARAGGRPINFNLQLPTGAQRVPLALAKQGGSCVCLPPGARGSLVEASRRVPFAELTPIEALGLDAETDSCSVYALPDGAQARIEYQGLTFVVSSTDQPRLPLPRRSLRDFLREHTWTMVSVGAHFGVLLLFSLLPPRSAALSLVDGDLERRFAPYLVTPPSLDPIPQTGATERDLAGGERTPAPVDAARDATAPAPKRPSRNSEKATTTSSPQVTLTREEARALAAGSGIIALLRKGAPSVGRVLAAAEDFSGDGTGNRLGDFLGGPGGVGTLIGLAPGGPLRVNGAIGVGRLGTDGGVMDDGRFGALREHVPRRPEIGHRGAKVIGSISKEAIRRVISLHLREVRFCYQQGLVGRPDLQGRVAVQFVIGESGAVRIARGVGSDASLGEVARCIEAAVQRWQFPAPGAGGIASVNYPFMLQLSGD